AVAAPAPRILAAALLKRDHLVAAALLHHLGGDAGAGNGRHAELRGVATQHQHVAELHDLARFALDPFDPEQLVLGDPVLLAAGFNDCEHRSHPAFDPGARTSGPAFSSRFVVWLQALGAVTNARTERPAPPANLWRRAAELSRKPGLTGVRRD